VAPVFEYLDATPRAVRIRQYEVNGTEARIDAGLLRAAAKLPPEPVLEQRTNSLAVRTDGAEAGLLVLRERWTPGWRARVDGRPVSVLRVDGLLRGVEVPAGETMVEMTYRPALPVVLLLAALTAWLGVAVWQVFHVMGIRRRKTTTAVG
jgi:uncharacterized membrane protein YfhO